MSNPKLQTLDPRPKSGQVALLTVLLLSAVFLSATAIAGLLTSYQLSQVGRITDSTEALLAADAGVERALFAVFRCNSLTMPPGYPTGWNDGAINTDVGVFCPVVKNQKTPEIFCPSAAPQNFPPPFCNEASYELNIESFDQGPGVFDQTASSSNISLISVTGHSGKTARSFEIKFAKGSSGGSGTGPVE